MTAQKMITAVKTLAEGLHFDVVSIGYPGPVLHNRAIVEPHNLGKGWVGCDFGKAFGKPVKLVNDALMQAVGSYDGGRMLFLGLGTGLGAAMIVDNIAEPMELAHLPYKKGRTFEDYVGEVALEKHGKKKWRKYVADVVERLTAALEPDYVVIGGGNVAKLEELPPKARRGDNANAFKGGFRLWRDKALVI
jgi:polyphosphate glucokinase